MELNGPLVKSSTSFETDYHKSQQLLYKESNHLPMDFYFPEWINNY